MGGYLSTPNTKKETHIADNHAFEVGVSCMQGTCISCCPLTHGAERANARGLVGFEKCCPSRYRFGFQLFCEGSGVIVDIKTITACTLGLEPVIYMSFEVPRGVQAKLSLDV